jgi:hypothetical protein
MLILLGNRSFLLTEVLSDLPPILHQTLPLPCQPGVMPGVFTGVKMTLGDCIDKLIVSKKAGNRRDVYLKSLRHYLDRFASGRVHLAVSAVSTFDVETWLTDFPNRAGCAGVVGVREV